MDDATQAIRILNDGGIVIYPTDTAFGMGCRMDSEQSVDRLFAIRKRPLSQATPVLVGSQEMAFPYLVSPRDIVRRLMAKYWPGALTIVAETPTDMIYSPIRGNTNGIGLRMPNHETALDLINGVGVPILGPSANFHGKPTPYDMADLDPELVRLVDYVVSGTCTLKQASTVVDTMVSPVRIIRQGALVLESADLI